MKDSGQILSVVAILVGLLIIFLLSREIICWYWKINKGIALLTEIKDLLVKGANSSSSAGSARSPLEEAQGHRIAAANLAASGHNAAQISKELQKWRGLSAQDADSIAASTLNKS